MTDKDQRIADYLLLTRMEVGPDQALYAAAPPDRLGVVADRVLLEVVSGVSGEGALKRAVDELRLYAAVESPYLVRLLDAGQDGDCIFYALEYPTLGTFEHPSEELTDRQLVSALADAARGAHALHEAGIVHRNITPSSVLLHEGGARLANLSMAKALVPEGSVSRFPNVADIEFVDPRLMLGDSPSRATDVWSLGAVLHWAMTGGVSLHPGRSERDAFAAVRLVLTEPPVVSSSLSEPIAAVVRHALAPEPQDRPDTAEAYADEVDELARGLR